MPSFTFIPSGQSRELEADVRALFDDLARQLPLEQRAFSGQWNPALDVYETDAALEVVVDVSGVAANALRVLFRAGVLIVAGEKAAARIGPEQTFHLVEREFGRFARAIRLSGAFDVPRARAETRDGELRILLPKMSDRRGQAHRIEVT